MTPPLALAGPAPPAWLVAPFVALLVLIATGPLFFPHLWHRRYPAFAAGLAAVVAAVYLALLRDAAPLVHAAEEFFAFVALVGALYVVAGTVLVETDAAGTPRSNTALLGLGAVLASVVGTTGASMLLIRPFLRMNGGRLRPYHVAFFIFAVSNAGGMLTPVGDPPLFLGFLRGVPFWWTLQHLALPWAIAVGGILAVFYVVDARNPARGTRATLAAAGADVRPGEGEDAAQIPVFQTRRHLVVVGRRGLAWLAVVIALIFVDPAVLPAMRGTVLDLKAFGLPFGLREVLLGVVAAVAYRTAEPAALAGNEFSFGPIREIAWLFAGIFVTMQPALELIRLWAVENAAGLSVTTFYVGTGLLSGVLDNAPTYVSFLAAAMGKFGADVNVPAQVAAFAAGARLPAETFYLEAVSVAAVLGGALTYIGNGPNFMVKAVAEASDAPTPTFGGYVFRYAVPVLVPIYALVWLVCFSGAIVPHPPDTATWPAAASPP